MCVYAFKTKRDERRLSLQYITTGEAVQGALKRIQNVVVARTVQEMYLGRFILREVVSNGLGGISPVHVSDSYSHIQGRAQCNDVDVIALLEHRLHFLQDRTDEGYLIKRISYGHISTGKLINRSGLVLDSHYSHQLIAHHLNDRKIHLTPS